LRSWEFGLASAFTRRTICQTRRIPIKRLVDLNSFGGGSGGIHHLFSAESFLPSNLSRFRKPRFICLASNKSHFCSTLVTSAGGAEGTLHHMIVGLSPKRLNCWRLLRRNPAPLRTDAVTANHRNDLIGLVTIFG
jgi:hypothetical protein